MNTLHDRFPDFDFGEDARDDHNDPLQSSYEISVSLNKVKLVC